MAILGLLTCGTQVELYLIYLQFCLMRLRRQSQYGWQLALVAIAPLIGNAFTPFLGFNGGTGVAVVYGAWLALIGWEGPVIMAASFGLIFIFIRETPWCVFIGMFILIAYLLILEYPLHLVGTCAGHDAIIWYKRRQHFAHQPLLQNWIVGHSRKQA